MGLEDPMLAYILIKRQNELASYLQRGRRHHQAPTQKLKDRWVALTHEWGKCGWDFDHGEREDVEYELELRGVELPGELVKDAFASLGKLARKAVKPGKAGKRNDTPN